MLTGAQALVTTLEALGAKRMYGVPGGQTLSIIEALNKDHSMAFVTARHEGGAAVMADAEGRLTGVPGVCLATTGPGATNLATGLGGALRDSSPVVAVTCNNYTANLGRDDAQNLNHVDALRAVTKHQELVTSPDRIAEATMRAFAIARHGCPGPVLLDCTRDALESELDDGYAMPGVERMWSEVEACREAIDALQAFIDQHDRPLLWVGNGAKVAQAGASVLALARRAQVPIITTFNGLGSVPTTDPHVQGVLFRHGTTLTKELVADADAVLAVGNSLNAVTTGRWSLKLPSLAHVDIEPATIGRYYRTGIGVVGHARPVLRALSARQYPRADIRRGWVSRACRLRNAWLASVVPAAADGQDRWDPVALVNAINMLTLQDPRPVIWCVDAGNPGIWSVVLKLRDQDRYLKPVGFGNMGFAVPAAVAAAHADPSALVVALVGDGSLGMTLGELETLVRTSSRVAVVVMDDGGYGNIRQEYRWKYGTDSSVAMDFGPAQYDAVGTALGMASFRLRNGDHDTLQQARAAVGKEGPVLIHALIEGERSVWPKAF